MDLIVKNGVVYDPKNKVNGERMDIHIKNGKIVSKVDESTAKTIDAKDLLVMPGGVDLHSHIAGPKVNAGRLLRCDDHIRSRNRYARTAVTRSGVGRSIPSTFTTGYLYSEMGYTTVFEPASPPLESLHTHDELNDIPMVDKGCFTLLGNNWHIMEYLRDDRLEECAAYVAWVMNAMKGYAIKIVNPGGIETWGWGKNVRDLDDEVPNFGITPREIIRGLCKINKLLGLPHPIHVHANRLGIPGNYKTTLRTIDCVRDLYDGGKPIIHLTHAQFNAYGGVDWASVSSRMDKIADYVNKHPHVSTDLGQVIFTDTTTMTADGPFEYQLSRLTGNRWVNKDIEAETGSGIVPVVYRRNNYVHAVMWTMGLELALLVKNPWRVFMTTDHPNGGPFTRYGQVISWLMSKEARNKILKRVPRLARVRSNLGSIDREYTFQELAITTRAAPARSLGLDSKGHLGVGADADVSVYPLKPKNLDPSKSYEEVRKGMRRANCTIKDGEIVVLDGKVVASRLGRTFWVRPHVENDVYARMKEELAKKFNDYYSVQIENYGVPESFIAKSAPLDAPVHKEVT